MDSVFQEIAQIATARLKEVLGEDQGFDADMFEQQVREFTRELGQQMLQVWAEEKLEQAHFQAGRCWCGAQRRVQKRKRLWWLTTFGRVEIVEPYLVCPKGHGSERPFQRLSGISCRGKSCALVRVLTDFGAEKSFGQSALQLWEHYGVRLEAGSIRRVVKAQAARAEKYVASMHQTALVDYQEQREVRQGEEWLIVESDGSMVRTGSLEPAPEGGLSARRCLPKRRRQSQWREVRLTTVEDSPGRVEPATEGQRLYGAVMGTAGQVGPQMFGLALLMGWGEQTLVHGVGDGAPWIAQQMAEVFPKQHYLLDRYHLLEHLYAGAMGLTQALSHQEWVKGQLEAIDAGEVDKVLSECRKLAGQQPEHVLNQLARYLDNQRGHLDYAGAEALGLPVGSGAVEGGHRTVIQARLKLPGTWWSEETINPMLALRTLRANGWWEAFWN